ncbi:MAG TPA: DegT/DnrJ/EryC1/StrS family aminotransferase [Acidimicrobiia bacterium]|nr:DegT/DnrJ/EryC1/StrS family aminotransferase [Acidimicrobiia bacterium]
MTPDCFASEEIPLYRPLVEAEEVAAGSAELAAGWLGMGRAVAAFEEAVHRAIGAGSRATVAVSTGSAALHLAVIITGAGPGSEVIVPAFTHLADVQAVIAAGAEPVFCDIDPLTLCIDLDRAAELVGPATRAVVVMDYGPHLCDHAAAAALADERGLRIVHDAAHTFGSAYHGRPVGSFSDICVFSFDPVKALTAIDAGVVVVGDEIEMRRLRHLRLLGSDQPVEAIYRNEKTWDYDAVDIGYRYHLSNVHAAVGLAQLAKLDQIRAVRQAASRWYQERLKLVDGVQLPPTDFDDVNPFLYYVRVDPAIRDDLRSHLADRGIGTGIHWRPAHLQTRFSGFRHGPLHVTEQVGEEIISLPLHSAMSETVVDRVCAEIAAYFRGAGRARAALAQPASASDHRRYSA